MEPFPNPNMVQSGYVNPQVNVTNGGLPDGFVGGVPRLPDILPLVPDHIEHIAHRFRHSGYCNIRLIWNQWKNIR